jgi:peptide/nickel transport system substrate-binding protein
MVTARRTSPHASPTTGTRRANGLPSTLLLARLALMATLPAQGQGLRYAEDQAPGIVNPVFTTNMSEARLNELIFEGLYTDNQNLAYVPSLAESSDLSPERTELTVQLRRDVTWHDGTPFTAADVVFTIDAMKDRGTLSTEKGRVAWIAGAEAIDDHTVLLRFERPEARPEDKLLFKILPAHKFGSTALKRTDPFRNEPVGTGPYRFARYNDDNSISLESHADHRNPVSIHEIVMREVSDKNYQAKLLLYESLEALVRVLPRDLAVLQNNRKVELYPYQTNSWWYLGFNLERDPWSAPEVRQAVAHLVDVEALLAPIGTGDALTGPYVKSGPYYNHDVPSWETSNSRASALFQAAGYSQDSGRWIDSKGQPLTLNITAHQTLESSQEVVINLQSQLQSAGLDVQVEFLDEAAWKARVWREHDYDLVLSQWTFDRNEDIRDQFHSEGARNFSSYDNEKVDELLDKARDTTDPHEKKAALREVHRMVHDDTPMIFLWTLDSYAALSTRVGSVVIHPFYFFTFVNDWRME